MNTKQKYLNTWKSDSTKLVWFEHMGKVLYSAKDGTDQVIYNPKGAYDYVINDIAVSQLAGFLLDGREAKVIFAAIHLRLQENKKFSADQEYLLIAERAVKSYLKGKKLLESHHVSRT